MIKNLVKKFIPSFLIDWYHFWLAFIGAVIYGFPAKKLKIIGVTGTNGKSTVVNLTAKILEEAGFEIALISSIKFKTGKKEWLNDLKMTMPGRLKIQRFLKQAVNQNCQYAIIEATSEGIKQHRHKFLDFDMAVFTNLTPEHIESHGSFEKYKETKGKLFRSLKESKKPEKISIVNLDDENSEYFLSFWADQKIGYTIKLTTQNSKSQLKTQNLKIIKAENYQLSSDGLKFLVDRTAFNLHLIGEFNVYNALAAISIAVSQGIDLEICRKALEKIEDIPGRMEEVIKKPFRVFVDYAHTPDALQKVYQTISGFKFQISGSKTICVLGSCGGGRDKWKRPELGKIAENFCDQIILTNEDPYEEDPESIINQIESGIKSKNKVFKILDRKEAIRKSLNLANPNDVIIITGKGCEPWMCVAGGKKISWDDRKIAKEEFKKLNL